MKREIRRRGTYTAFAHARISNKGIGHLPYSDQKLTDSQVTLERNYAAMGVRLELSFLAAASSASLTAWIARFLSSSICCAFAANALP